MSMAASKRARLRRAPQQARSRLTLDQILTAAAQVFASRGYAAGSTNHIARRAGVSIGSLYQYFPNKEAMVVLLLERHVQQAEAVLEELLAEAVTTAAPLDEALTRFVEAMVALHADAARVQKVLIEEGARIPRARSLIQQGEARMCAGVEALLRSRDDLAIRRPRHAAFFIVHSVEHLVHQFVLAPPPGLGKRAFVAELVALLHGYLSRSDGQASSTKRRAPRVSSGQPGTAGGRTS
jgi:AcrR family transcriptional regulator